MDHTSVSHSAVEISAQETCGHPHPDADLAPQVMPDVASILLRPMLPQLPAPVAKQAGPPPPLPSSASDHAVAPRRFDDGDVVVAEIDDGPVDIAPAPAASFADSLRLSGSKNVSMDLRIPATIGIPEFATGAHLEALDPDAELKLTRVSEEPDPIFAGRTEIDLVDEDEDVDDDQALAEVVAELEAETEEAPDEPQLPAYFGEADSSLRPAETRVIALMNQKGGVGKTTTAVSIGAALSHMGMRVLMIDLDPQAHMSLHVGVEPDLLEHTVYHMLADDGVKAEDVIVPVSEYISVIPAEVNLAGIETELAPKMVNGSAQQILKDKLARYVGPTSPDAQSSDAHPQPFDYIIIDCPPSLGLLTINALIFAHEVMVPMQAHFLALQGLSKLLETVNLIRMSFNPTLTVAGIVLCMYEGQTILAQEVMADLNDFLDDSRNQDVPWRDAVVYDPPVRRNIKLAECPSFGESIYHYAPESNGAKDYYKLALSLAKQNAAT